jgi:hypothetical protein
MEIECKECKRKFTDKINDAPMTMYEHGGEAVCADCIVGMGVLPPHDKAGHNTLLVETVRYMMRPN